METTLLTKECKKCGKEFNKFPSDSKRYWNIKSFCSTRCANTFNDNSRLLKGIPRPAHVVEKMRATMFKKGLIPWNKSELGTQKWRDSREYKLWKKAVYERDENTCVWCGFKGDNKKSVTIHADHILPVATHPELRFAIDNGRTLCKSCHYKRHYNKELQWHNFELR